MFASMINASTRKIFPLSRCSFQNLKSLLALNLLLLFHLLFNSWWLYVDNHAIETDEETHMLMAREYYTALFPVSGDRSLSARLTALAQIEPDVGNPIHPPLLYLCGAILIRILGYSVDHLAFVNTLAFLFAIVGVYCIAKQFLEWPKALFVAFVFSFTPMVYVASRYFMTDFLSMTLMVWIVYALIRSDGLSHWSWSLLVGVLNGFALLARTTVLLYYFFPGLLIATTGIYRLIRRKVQGEPHTGDALFHFFINVVLVITISLAICSPWYVAHGKRFIKYWITSNEKGYGSPVSILENGTTSTSPLLDTNGRQESRGKERTKENSKAPVEQNSESHQEQTPSGTTQTVLSNPATHEVHFTFAPKIPWIRYPVLVINNATFLPMFLMSLLGMILCVLVARWRNSLIPWILISWLLGSYVLLTILLNFSTPRYALQALPALAMLSALPLLAIPKGSFRRIGKILYVGILVFQYGNLTVHAYGPISTAYLPMVLDPVFQERYDDRGLYFFKPVLHGSFSFSRMQAPQKENFKDRLFFSMLKWERGHNFYGVTANYARLNVRGMLLDEQHFWLADNKANPFRRTDIPPDLTPYRNFRQYGWGHKLEDIDPILDLVDYIVYTTEGVDHKKEDQWLSSCARRGFKLIDHFYEKRSGVTPERYFGLLARLPDYDLSKISDLATIQNLSLEDAYKVRRSAMFSQFDTAMQQAVINQLRNQLFAKGRPVPLISNVDFYLAQVEHSYHDVYIARLWVINSSMGTTGNRVAVQALFAPEELTGEPRNTSGNLMVICANAELTPPPPLWPQEEPFQLCFPFSMHPIQCHLQFAIYDPASGLSGHMIDLGTIHLGLLPRKNK